jgi:hypothetical protein
MLFLANVVDYPVEERQPRVHHRFTIPYLRLFDSQGLPLGAVQKFDTTTMLGTRKDGSTVGCAQTSPASRCCGVACHQTSTT